MDREPDLELDAHLELSNGASQLCDCKIWLPKEASVDALVELWVPSSPDSPICAGPGPLSLRGNKGDSTQVVATGMWVESGPAQVWPKRLAGRSQIQLSHVEALTQLHHFERSPQGEDWALSFGLSDCQYLSPAKLIQHHYTGEIKVETAHQFTVVYPGLGRVDFERHFHFDRRHGVSGTVITSSLVANVVEPTAALFASPESTLLLVDDMCLLASFAARHRVLAIEVTSQHDAEYRKTWLNPLRRPRPKQQCPRGDGLIDLADFEEFFGGAARKFLASHPLDKQRLREAMYPLVPAFAIGGEESAFLALFAALEGLVGYGESASRERVLLQPNRWKRVKRAMGDAIDSLGDAMTEAEKDAMRRKLIELNRPPLRDSVDRFVRSNGIDVSDLWPLFGSPALPGLCEIRNRLAHGNRPGEGSLGALGIARMHLSMIVERCLLKLLGFDVSRTHASPGRAVYQTETGSERVTEYRQMLRTSPVDAA